LKKFRRNWTRNTKVISSILEEKGSVHGEKK